MKKSGFTLAEVLITLGIIGVVAALTAPALVTQSRNEANAARLSVAVSNLENAFTNAMSTQNVDRLTDLTFWATTNRNSNANTIAAFVGNLKRFIHMTDFSTGDSANYYADAPVSEINGTAEQNNIITDGNKYRIVTKQGIVYWIDTHGAALGANNRTEAVVRGLGGSYWETAGEVVIDVNGASAPNRYGRDIFLFDLGNNGILYPAGGVDFSIYNNGDRTHLWSTANANENCPGGAGEGCAGRVIAEGYRINY